MATGALDRKGDIIEDVAARIRSRLDPQEAETSERFVRQFLANAAPEDVENHSTDDLYGAALSLWKLGATRTAGESLVRVYNPRVDENGWHSRHTILELVMEDLPFLFDSVAAYLNESAGEVHLAIHPIVEVERDVDGTLKTLKPKIDGHPDSQREAFMHFQVTEQPEEDLDRIRTGLQRVLTEVRAAVEDFGPMCDRCTSLIGNLDNGHSKDVTEAEAFLHWLTDNHFSFLGYRQYEFEGETARVKPGTGLGILRDELASVFDGILTGGRRPAELDRSKLLRITKTNRRSLVHRPVPMDGIGVKAYDEQGNVVGEHLFIGLFTSRAYGRTPNQIPILRRKVSAVQEQAGFHSSSYDARTLAHILDTYPRDELYQTPLEELKKITLGILHLQERRRLAFFHRVDPFQRFVSCLVYIPRDQYDTDLRKRIQEILESSLDGQVTGLDTRLSDSAHARLHMIVQASNGTVPPFDAQLIESRIIEAGRSWKDQLEHALVEAYDEKTATRHLRRFGTAFPASYRDHFTEAIAVSDIARIEEALTTRDVALNLYRPIEAADDEVHFKLYTAGSETPLSDVLPMLENMGFQVLREVPYRVRPADLTQSIWIRDFALRARDGSTIDVPAIRERLHEAFHGVWRKEVENDGFNQLVMRAHVSARGVAALRMYCKFLLQARIAFSQQYMEETLAANPGAARLLVDLFRIRFDPEHTGDRDLDAATVKEKIEMLLEDVPNLDEDRILRAFLNVIDASLRTNYFQRDVHDQPKPYMAVKLESGRIDNLPKPRPLYEIFVCSPRMEGVHLRGGKVARGGIRWSDRREDFRTEILGLMKAQMVKNAVIVPVGSKGGFVVKQPPENYTALQGEVVACYRMLMAGLLDLTDNRVGDDVVPPKDVVRHDGDDPYLVVAADKGTATFSDIANDMSEKYGFWLDDAFASGGSAGYDHKAMGITAKGAWESVKRHFREVGKDIQSEDFTVVGVGDMGGDVFGNGMLLSEHIRLIGAFNHMHIFVDPEPDAATSFAERKRLFELQGSTWDDYDRKLISDGGGVWPRSAKRIPVSDAMRARFGLEGEHVTPSALIRSLLTTQAELLWLGGIGTYVRASDEVDTQVGDRANDSLRIDATEVGAQVVGEGANLGFTQRARIEYALGGGRINTDAIDNSAGVDCSDHEVNIKILIGEVERDGDLTRKQRNELLEAMTDEVGTLVLRDNYLQTQSITVTQDLGAHLLDRLGRLMRRLEREGRLDRRIEFLPDDEALAERMARGLGLTRPEISVLLAYAKMELYDSLLASNLPDDPDVGEVLQRYFPAQLRERYPDRIAEHRLRREIVATLVTNDIVNRVGIVFAHEVQETTGMQTCAIARAYLISRQLFELPDLWHEVEALDNVVPASVQATLLAECGRLIERGTIWFLRHGSQPLDIGQELEAYSEGVQTLIAQLEDFLDDAQRDLLEARAAELVAEGAPPALARRIAPLRYLAPACDIVGVARAKSLDVPHVAKMYWTIGTRFGFHWLRRASGNLASDTAWDKLAVTSLRDDLDAHQIELTKRVLTAPGGNRTADEAIEAWTESRKTLVTRTDALLSELQSHATTDLAMLAVANRQLKAMIG